MSRPHFGRGPRNRNNQTDFEKAADFTKTWKQLISYCKAYLPLVIFALVIAATASVLQFLGPDRLKDLTNEIANGLPVLSNGQETVGLIDMSKITTIIKSLIIIYATAALLSLSENVIMATITAKITKNMRSHITEKINKLPLKYFDKVSYGDIISRITNDVDAIGNTLNQNIDTMVRAITMFFGCLAMMFYTNWIMALTGIVSSLLGFLFINFVISFSQKYFKAQQQGLGDINGHIEEIYTGHNIVKVYNAGKQAVTTFESINDRLYESSWKSQFLSGLMMPMMMFFGNFGYVIICVVGASLAFYGYISFGIIVAFIMYIRMFTQPLSQLAQALQALQRTAAAGERFFNFIDEVELSDESAKTTNLGLLKGDVEFKNVRFGYDPEKVIIKDFSAKIKVGQKIAIVGPTGAGKTTLVNLLMRFYDIDDGFIYLDGIDTATVTRENVHEQFCMVLQDTWIFEGTIKENIIFSKTAISDQQVIDACKAVGIHYFIQTLPLGYDTVLNDKSSLSTGQKQLITIARAMIQNAPLLILDEATSSVDTRTERIVQEAMDTLTKGRTSFVIAHRLSTIKNADIILVIKEGDIVESGNHQQLLDKNGFYAELYNSQFEDIN